MQIKGEESGYVSIGEMGVLYLSDDISDYSKNYSVYSATWVKLSLLIGFDKLVVI